MQRWQRCLVDLAKPDPNVIVLAGQAIRISVTKLSVHIQCAQMLQCYWNALLQAFQNLSVIQNFRQLLEKMLRGLHTTALVTLTHITKLQSFHQNNWPWQNSIYIHSQIAIVTLFCLRRRPLSTRQLRWQNAILQLCNLPMLLHLACTQTLQQQLQLIMRKQTLPIGRVVEQAILVWFVRHRFNQTRALHGCAACQTPYALLDAAPLPAPSSSNNCTPPHNSNHSQDLPPLLMQPKVASSTVPHLLPSSAKLLHAWPPLQPMGCCVKLI